MLLGEENFILISDFKCVFNQIVVDMFSGLCHVDLLLIIILGKKIRQGSTMIKMSVRDDNHGELLGIEFIE